MPFRKIESLTCLVREKRRLKLTCECGHIALFDPLPLRSEFWMRCKSEELAHLHKAMKCSKCGGRQFLVEHVPLVCAADEAANTGA